MNDLLERIKRASEHLESRRIEMIDCLVVVKSRWDEIRTILNAESPSPVEGSYLGIPVIVAESDVDVSSKLIGSSYNRVMVVYSDRIMDANLKALRERAEADMQSWIHAHSPYSGFADFPTTYKPRCDS